MGAALSGSLPSTWNSRWPRGRWTASGRAPCSYSSGSRTSRKVTPPPSSRACASAWSTSRMDFLASFSRSRGVGTLEPPGRTSPSFHGRYQKVKHYQRGQHSRGDGRGPSERRWETPGHGTARGDPPARHGAELLRRARRGGGRRPDPRGALRSPTAGNTRGTAWVVLEGPAQTAVYFDATTDEAWRTGHPEWCDGLRRAPVVLLAYTSPEAYVARYAEADKAALRARHGSRGMARPLLVRRRGLRRHDGPSGRSRRRARSLRPRRLPGGGRAGGPARASRPAGASSAPCARSPRRPRPPLGVARQVPPDDADRIHRARW